MNAHAIKAKTVYDHLQQQIPSTPRGRALYTTDWYLNGKPGFHQHDNQHLSITSVSRP